MKLESDLFELEAKNDFTFYLHEFNENKSNRSLYFTRNNNFHDGQSEILLGSIECVAGTFEDGIFESIHELKQIEVAALEGYIEEPNDAFPFEFSTIFRSDNSFEVHHYLVQDSGYGYVVLVTLISGFLESDVEDVREMLSEIKCKSIPTSPNFAELMPIHFLLEES